MDNRSKEIKLIFSEAYKKKSLRERRDYLDKQCGTDTDLRIDVESLLEAYDDADGFLDAPILNAEVTLDNSTVSEGPSSIIGPYKLLEKIGEGGMAVVYMAQQERPLRRKVALKIIKVGMDTKQVIARFEAERQALALMDHPNIAKVLDAGATDTGRPYFVMELVKGLSITEYCDTHELSTKERLDLFIQVCKALQHAHQKGIIHRDIKPSNVMVTQRDGAPTAKVIDFGIAKATHQRLTEKTLFTRYAHIIGTPAYMSPEQAELSDVDIDTRSDIYSLGILLYELLTGKTPFSEEQLRKAGYLEMQRVIREEEPVKPSTKLSTMGAPLTEIAQHRRVTPDALRRLIQGDLDWIVMRTLEKDRDRRYDNASILAMDVRRHLDDQPILARAPSTIYRFRKFLRRHRSQALAALTISVLFVAIVTMILLLNHSRQQSLQTESDKHKRTLYKTHLSFVKGDHAEAIENLRSILDSKHVGNEAQYLYDSILTNAHKQITYYSSRIEANPGDAESYLHRARYHYYLQDKERVLADMDSYAAILNPSTEISSGNSRFRNLVVGLWGNTPTPLGPTVNSSSCEGGPCLSAGRVELYFYSDQSGGMGSDSQWAFDAFDIWLATRETIGDDWGTPVNLGPAINSTTPDSSPCLSADDLSLFFESKRPGGAGGLDLWITTRTTVSDPWGTPVNLGPKVNSSAFDMGASISADGRTLVFQSNRPGGAGAEDIYVSTRTTASNPWGRAVNLGPTVNSSTFDGQPYLTPDGLVLLFCSNRPGGFGDWDIWVTTRETTDDTWSTPMNLGPLVNTSAGEAEPFVSPDGHVLYFSDWMAPRPGGVGSIDLWKTVVERRIE